MGFAFFALIIGVTALLSVPLGRYMAWVLDSSNGAQSIHPALRAHDAMVSPAGRQAVGWKQYAVQMMVATGVMFTVVYLTLSFQHLLPLNPDGRGPIEQSLVFNTVTSFTTNTNLQHYSGEVTLSYLSQMALMFLQFLTPATGLAAVAAIARALRGDERVGSFLVDMGRATVFILLPLAALTAIVLVLLGVPMTFRGAATATTLEGAIQTIARGPVAAFVAIKQLGTNGGGFFGPNSTHPFENPMWATNIISNVAILLIPMATVWMVGRIIRRPRHSRMIFGVMLAFFLVMVTTAVLSERGNTVALAELPISDSAVNLEGKELRFGSDAGSLWAVSTTATSNGSVGAMHNSLNPLTGLVPKVGMWLNVVFGGVGVGYINMFIFVIVTVFIAGLMVGRTPEFMGRKVESREMTLALFALIVPAFMIIVGTAWFASTPFGQGSVNNPGSRGFSEIVYEFSSAAANNGSGFEGLSDNSVAWNVVTGIVMALGRFVPIILPLGIAGSLSVKKPTPVTSGTLDTDGLVFAGMLTAVIVLVGALLFLPIAVLGPVSEHLEFLVLRSPS